ncbi:[citrate (pro-3S)-lyase] ligase [Clostridium sediminicola]|uniref:[citrate (pro-3S)-lyase] ligase n=1 Tax=Clostridium sediminicola TaxID=3114879 RepID=UPI0031F1FB17
MNGIYYPEKVDLNDEYERKELEEFLKHYDLSFDKDIDYSLAIRIEQKIIATCSKAKNVLKCFAVSEKMRGEGLTSILVSRMLDKLFEEKIYHSFIFTKPKEKSKFESLNYKLIYETGEVALLEHGKYDINKYLEEIKSKNSINNEEKAALVMTCNPFTLGHKYLIEKTASENQNVLIFIVEEDKFLFPFKTRYELVKRGVKHLKNVKVVPSGEYLISSSTFPSYFLKEDSKIEKIYTELDAGVFAKYFCSKFNITKRCVGEEPYCKVTSQYNKTLEKVLKEFKVEFCEIERKKHDDKYISASLVRKLLKEKKLYLTKDILPKVTWDFLNSKDGREIIQKLK